MSRPNRTILEMVVVGVVASAIGIVLGLVVDWFPRAASTQAGPIDTLWDVLLIVSIPIFVLVTIIVIYAVRLFRVRPGQEQQDGEPIHGNTRLEIVWTAVPSMLIAGLVIYAYLVLVDIERAPASQERRVAVVSEQFAWRFEYDGGGKKVVSDQLVLPVGESIRFDVTTKDVLHSFWVPEFRMKIDAVPGITTNFRATPDKTGSFAVVCAELCGLGHAFMRAPVRVLPREEFEEWLADKAAADQAGAGGTGQRAGGAPDAKQIFTEGNGTSTACGSCHTLADAGTQASTGPDLDQVLADKDGAYIREAILQPAAELTDGFPDVMPKDYGETLSDDELEALVNYLDKVTSR